MNQWVLVIHAEIGVWRARPPCIRRRLFTGLESGKGKGNSHLSYGWGLLDVGRLHPCTPQMA